MDKPSSSSSQCEEGNVRKKVTRYENKQFEGMEMETGYESDPPVATEHHDIIRKVYLLCIEPRRQTHQCFLVSHIAT